MLFTQFPQPKQIDAFPVFSINLCFPGLFFSLVGYDGSRIAEREVKISVRFFLIKLQVDQL